METKGTSFNGPLVSMNSRKQRNKRKQSRGPSCQRFVMRLCLKIPFCVLNTDWYYTEYMSDSIYSEILLLISYPAPTNQPQCSRQLTILKSILKWLTCTFQPRKCWESRSYWCLSEVCNWVISQAQTKLGRPVVDQESQECSLSKQKTPYCSV